MVMETALPDAIRTFCRGILHAIGMFDPADLTNEEKAQDPAEFRTWFCVGETCMAALLAGNIAVPAGFWFAGIAALPLAVIGAAVLFLPLFVFLPRLIRSSVKSDTDAVLERIRQERTDQKGLGPLCRHCRPRAGPGGEPDSGRKDRRDNRRDRTVNKWWGSDPPPVF
jgi:hypothetical protein